MRDVGWEPRARSLDIPATLVVRTSLLKSRIMISKVSAAAAAGEMGRRLSVSHD